MQKEPDGTFRPMAMGQVRDGRLGWGCRTWPPRLQILPTCPAVGSSSPSAAHRALLQSWRGLGPTNLGIRCRMARGPGGSLAPSVDRQIEQPASAMGWESCSLHCCGAALCCATQHKTARCWDAVPGCSAGMQRRDAAQGCSAGVQCNAVQCRAAHCGAGQCNVMQRRAGHCRGAVQGSAALCRGAVFPGTRVPPWGCSSL